MNTKSYALKRLLLTASLTMLVSACASPCKVAQVEPLNIPALSQSAQQPPLTDFCLPSCSEALMKERERWLSLLENQD